MLPPTRDFAFVSTKAVLAKKRTENLKILCPFPFVLDFTALSQVPFRVSFSYSWTEKIVCKGMQFDEKEGTMVDFFFEVC